MLQHVLTTQPAARRSARRYPILAATLILASGVASAQTWSKWYKPPYPASRFAGPCVFDGAQGYSMLFSGLGHTTVQGPVALNDTWTFTSTGWTQLSPATSPPPRYGASLAYDQLHGDVLVFAGAFFNNNYIITPMNDTWTWNGTTWTQLSPAASPSVRYLFAMAYDSAHNQTVVFGGVNLVGYLGDTWVFDGTNWTQKFPVHTPAQRGSAAMAFDATNQNIVMFGGVNAAGALDDTWVWNGTDWTQMAPAVSPAARYGSGFAYETAYGNTVLNGGTNLTSNYGDTWAWTGSNWYQEGGDSTVPTQRFYACMDYDGTLGEILMFAGGFGTGHGDIYLDDTWLFK